MSKVSISCGLLVSTSWSLTERFDFSLGSHSLSIMLLKPERLFNNDRISRLCHPFLRQFSGRALDSQPRELGFESW